MVIVMDMSSGCIETVARHDPPVAVEAVVGAVSAGAAFANVPVARLELQQADAHRVAPPWRLCVPGDRF